jgi:hypothetical protein
MSSQTTLAGGDCANSVVETEIYFLKRDSKFEAEKPYAFRYAVDNVPQTNMVMEPEPVLITDIRGSEDRFSVDIHGFAVLKFESGLSYDDFYDESKVSQYFRGLENLLKLHLDANRVEVFRHGVSNLPISCNEADSIISCANDILSSQYQLARSMTMTNQLLWPTSVRSRC